MTDSSRAGGLLTRWPRSARQARMHAALTAAVLWIALVATFVAGSGHRSIAGPLKGADFLQFYTLGSLVTRGDTGSLYDLEALHDAQVALVPESAPEFYPPVYPPQASLLFAPLSRFSFATATLVWTLITIGVFAAIIRSVWRPLSAQLPDAGFVFVAAAAFPPLWSLLLFGQVTILILAAFWAGWIAMERGKPFLAGAAFGLLLLKPQFAIPLAVIVVCDRNWLMLAGAAMSIGIQILCTVVLLDWSVLHAYAGFVPIMLQLADLLQAKPFQSHSLRALTRLAPFGLAAPLWCLLSGTVLFFMVRIWRTAAPLRVRFGVVVLAAVLVNPHLLIYDATVLALPLLWFGAYVQERGVAEERLWYWTTVYWLFVTLLAPTARVIGVQVSVLLMMWLMVLIARYTRQEHRAERDAASAEIMTPVPALTS